ncbi:MAG TPA: DUF1254 domain-containing protein [Hyphomicrobiales bacterium]|nr:DUF1254 domain-containing protein [Rhodobiaceae bacterium]HXK54461.1 DUF1254 domain-containing protein [Hyphomicrobiales bacterium]
MKSVLLSVVAGLILGALIHIASILTIPWAAENNAWSRLRGLAEINEVRRIEPDASGKSDLPDLDPAMHYAVCHYDLARGPLQIRAPVPRTYWSLALYDRLGINYYVINDRIVGPGELEVWVANKTQLLEIEPEDSENSGTSGEGESKDRLIVGAPRQQGFAVFRLLVPGASFEQTVEQALSGTSCATIILPGAPGAGNG